MARLENAGASKDKPNRSYLAVSKGIAVVECG